MNFVSVYNKLQNKSTIIKLLFELDGRQYTLARPSTDLVGKTLKRIGISVLKEKEKKSSTAIAPNDAKEIPVRLFLQNGAVVDDDVSNSVAWSEGNILHIANEKFFIEENTPSVTSASIPSVIMAGFPVVPTLKMEFSDKLSSQYKWFKQKSCTTEALASVGKCLGSSTQQHETEGEWIETGQEFSYVPKVDDIGYLLKLSCKAASSEREAHKWFSSVGPSPVSASPGLTPFEERQLYTSRPVSDPSTIRVLSYNILADCYLVDNAIKEAWFGYCPKYALEIDYRQQLLLKEILGYNADIMCLQECGRHLFDSYLTPVMQSKGYAGFAIYKSGAMIEGEAIFFRQSRFTLASHHDIVVKDCFLKDPSNTEMLTSLQHYPEGLKRLTSKTTVAQVLVLQHNSSTQNYICLVNTHLYFRPNAPFIRDLQAIAILNHVDKTVKKLEAELKESTTTEFSIGVLFCGDFNSSPESGVVQLMCGQPLEDTHPDWIVPLEKEEASVNLKMPTFHNPFEFENCCGFPAFTTYTEGFKGTIDYIFASKGTFKVEAVIPMPSAEDLDVYTAIPSPVVSSDHLALVCELKRKN